MNDMKSLDVTITTAGVSYSNKSIWDGVVFSYEQNWRNDSSIYCTGTSHKHTDKRQTDTQMHITQQTHTHTYVHTCTQLSTYVAI